MIGAFKRVMEVDAESGRLDKLSHDMESKIHLSTRADYGIVSLQGERSPDGI